MKNILITREEKLDKNLESLAKEKKINLIYFPLIKTIPINFEIINLDKFDFIIFSSKNGIRYFLKKEEIDKEMNIIAVGDKTASYLKNLGFKNVIVPKEKSSTGIERFIKENFLNKRFLHVTAKKGKRVNLKNVERVEVYDTVFNKPESKDKICEMIKEGKIDYILFSSPSTFISFKNLFENYKQLLKKVKIISIGNTTKEEIEKEGLDVDFVPLNPSFEDIFKQL